MRTVDLDLSFNRLRIANRKRALRWHGSLDEWSVNDWLVAFGGEAGEALNAGKKLHRIVTNMPQQGDVPDGYDDAVDRILDELADTVIYADLVAQRCGRRLSDAIIWKFNAISEREGFDERL